jgi:opacity protein-like surface antigen
MTYNLKAGLASAALAAVATLSSPIHAADLGGYRGGSVKDGGGHGYGGPTAGSVGNCYFRADVGYSWSKNPDLKFPVGNTVNTYDGTDAANPGNFVGSTYTQTGSGVNDTSMENTWLGEGGFGCGSGSLGVRGELMFGYRGDRKIDGKPGDYTVDTIYTGGPVLPSNPVIEDPLHTSVKTYTMMANVYKDLGKFGAVTPYVGFGVGLAYNQMSETYFTGTTTLTNRIAGDNDLSLAWSLMAGIGYQISDRAILDVGYRYMDMGKISSQRHDNAGNINPRVQVDDLAAHEFKIGLRYHFGASDCCAAQPAYAPMK